MILLRLISWPYFRKHVLRTLLTTAGIVLGVAVFVGMHTANSERAVRVLADRRPHRRQDRAAGDRRRDRLRRRSAREGPGGVHRPRRRAGDRSRRRHRTRRPGQPAGARRRHDRRSQPPRLRPRSGDDAVIDDPLVFLAQPDSIILSKEFAEKNQHRRRQPRRARHGRRRQAVHGARRHEVVGLTSAFGGNLADHGHLRRAADVRPRPLVRSHRPRA